MSFETVFQISAEAALRHDVFFFVAQLFLAIFSKGVVDILGLRFCVISLDAAALINCPMTSWSSK